MEEKKKTHNINELVYNQLVAQPYQGKSSKWLFEKHSNLMLGYSRIYLQDKKNYKKNL